MGIKSYKGQISTSTSELLHDRWPCVPLPLHYDMDGNLLSCEQAQKQRRINGLILKGGSRQKAVPYKEHAQ